jgi:hypothetical protein
VRLTATKLMSIVNLEDEERALADDLERYSNYPVVSLGLSYRF